METEVLSVREVDKAAEIIKRGGLVAMPTETVYGLAADALNGEAVAKIFRAKGRPMDNPLIVHIARVEQINELVSEFPEKARILAEKFWPGPLTIILPKSDRIPDEVSAGLDTVAVRLPGHAAARELIEKSCPLAAPSANLSGSPSPTTAGHVWQDMNGRIDAIIDGGACEVGVESTVISLAVDPPRLLRPGGITPAQLRDAIGEITVDSAVCHPLGEGQQAASPGMKYKHYAPKANVILIKGSAEAYIRYVNERQGENAAAMCCDEDTEYITLPCISMGKENEHESHAQRIFSLLRLADERGYSTVYARCTGEDGVELAVYNRMLRASGFEVIDLEK